jgi:hypothetical protein
VLDPTIPPILSRILDDFTTGRQLIEASPIREYSTINASLPVCMTLLAQRGSQGARAGMKRPIVGETGSSRELRAISNIQASFEHTRAVSRLDFSDAFDPIAASEKALQASPGYLEPSVFDRNLKIIALDVAPYVRGIVAYDYRLMEERVRRSNLLSEGGRPGKRMRNNRSAFSALEGGPRNTTRRENYFTASLNSHVVLETGGKWDQAVAEQLAIDMERLTSADGAGENGISST